MDWLPLGIDIAKRSFHVALLLQGKPRHRRCDNSPAGFAELLAWLERQGASHVHACLEATGTYGEALATFLAEAGHRGSVVNPKRITHFAKSRLARAKTDKLDAHLIALFCAQEPPPLWQPAAPMDRELQALVRHHHALLRTRQQERNRLLAAAHPTRVRSSLEALLAYLDQALETVEQRIREHLGAHPELQRQRELLLSIPGIGEATARWLLAELAGGTKFQRAGQAAAYVGVEPRLEESGTWKGKTRLSKQGSARLRCALYFPALPGLRCNPVLQALAARLRAAGKCPMVIVGAAMRKLVHLAFGVLHQGKPFDPAWGQRATATG